jgi:type IV secretory pathway VirB2 component (pilin)
VIVPSAFAIRRISRIEPIASATRRQIQPLGDGMMKRSTASIACRAALPLIFMISSVAAPDLVFAQAASPFETGATNLQTSVIAIAAPVAVLLVIALGVAAAAGRISVGWALGIILGIGLVFAAQPVVAWIRGLFGV